MDRHLREDVKSDCQFSIEIRGNGNAAYLDETKCVVLRNDRSGNPWDPVHVYGRPFLQQSHTGCTQDNGTKGKMDKRIPESIPDASDKRAGDQQSGGIYPDTACQGKDAWNRDTKVEAAYRAALKG